MLIAILVFVILTFLMIVGIYGAVDEARKYLKVLAEAKVSELKVFGNEDPRSR